MEHVGLHVGLSLPLAAVFISEINCILHAGCTKHSLLHNAFQTLPHSILDLPLGIICVYDATVAMATKDSTAHTKRHDMT